MRKLLSANFTRLWNSRVFWIGMSAMCGLGIMAVIMRYRDILEDPNYAYTTADGFWLLGGLYISVILSVFISLWLGTEYHDGTMRNKLTVGHTRGEIYAANWLTCTISSLIMHIGYILMIALFGALLLDPFTTPMRILVISVLISLLTVIAMSSVFVMFAMLINSKSTGAVISMLIALAMLISAITIYNMLIAPKYHEPDFQMSVNGEIQQGEPIPNPRYLRGTKREIYQFIEDFQPVGQMMLFNSEEDFPAHYERFPMYSLLLTAITTSIGYLLFLRKDIK